MRKVIAAKTGFKVTQEIDSGKNWFTLWFANGSVSDGIVWVVVMGSRSKKEVMQEFQSA